MPLSEHEQRILRQIEQDLQSDPGFTQRVTAVSRRRMAGLAVGVVIGLAATVLLLAVSAMAAFGAFVVVLLLGFLLEAEIRIFGRERLGSLPLSVWLGGRPPAGH